MLEIILTVTAAYNSAIGPIPDPLVPKDVEIIWLKFREHRQGYKDKAEKKKKKVPQTLETYGLQELQTCAKTNLSKCVMVWFGLLGFMAYQPL